MTKQLDQLTARIGETVSAILATDLALLRGYSQAKARSVASFTLLIGEGFAAGTVPEAQMQEEMVELQRMAARFVRNIQALAATAAERVLGAVIGVLLAALRQATGLPMLTMPAPLP